jgi:hypothetical protein
VRQTPARGRLLGPLPPGRRAKVRHEAARVHHAARRGGGRVGLLLEVERGAREHWRLMQKGVVINLLDKEIRDGGGAR